MAMILHIRLQQPIEQSLTSDIEKESAYVFPGLRQLRVTQEGTAIELDVDDTTDEAEIRSKVSRYLAAISSRFPKLETKVYFRNARQNSHPLVSDVYDELKRCGWLFELGTGYIGFAGPALALMHKIDSTFTRLYRQNFRAVDRMYPALIKADLLLKCGYFDSHPNLVSLVTHAIDDFDAIEQLRQVNEEAENFVIPDSKTLVTPHVCLNPAACFPCYPSFEGQTLDKKGDVLTWVGRVFRHESKNLCGLERLWEFNQRALVFMGTDQFVKTVRQQTLEIISRQITEWDLECQIETATDTFFATVAAARTFYQKSLETKAEIRLAIAPGSQGEDRTIAAGSINLHQDFFGRRFNITAADGKPAITGCVGLGLERWVLAIFTQHGFEPSRWPASLQADVF